MIAYVPDAYAAFDALGMEQPLPHDQAKPVAVHPDALVCKQVSSESIARINQLINAFKSTPRFNEIMAL